MVFKAKKSHKYLKKLLIFIKVILFNELSAGYNKTIGGWI
jgi:hypothetical protein